MTAATGGEDEPPASVLARAVELIGGQAALARLVGLAQPSVWRWIRQCKPLPGEHVIKVEKALQDLGSTISRHDLRPDLYPREEALSEPVDELQAAR